MSEAQPRSTPASESGRLARVLRDSNDRTARKLRISVTDRCNFRCIFCMPVEPVWLPHNEILTFEEVARLTRIFVSMGVSKIRLSGGEPLVRKDVERLVAMLSPIPGIHSINMTSNGYFLVEKARALKAAGLRGVTVSFHSLHPHRFEALTGKGAYEKVLAGIHVAKRAGLKVKLNTVAMRGYNEDEVVDLVRFAREEAVTLRFIEYMPFDGKKLWDVEKVFTGEEIIAQIQKQFPLVPLPREVGSTALEFRYADGAPGEIGLITSISKPFCSDCDRVRLKADGKLVPCLFSQDEYDVKLLLRRGAGDEELARFVRESFWKKAPGVETFLKLQMPLQHVRPMHTIGG